MSRILIVDDEVEILKPLESMLMEENFRVRSFSNPLNALEFLRTQSVDLAIFDIKMPELNGLDLLRHAREFHPGLPIIFLSSKNEDADQLVGFSIGADDYVGKPFTKQLLLLRVKAVLRRHAPMTNPTTKLIEVGSLVIDRERHLVQWEGQDIELTVTECLLLISLAERPGTVRKRQQLMDACYDGAVFVSDRTIDSHIRNIRGKFKAVDEAAEPIGTIQGLGYKLKL